MHKPGTSRPSPAPGAAPLSPAPAAPACRAHHKQAERHQQRAEPCTTSTMGLEGHPVIWISFALWCQSRVVQSNTRTYSGGRQKHEWNLTFFSAITEIMFLCFRLFLQTATPPAATTELPLLIHQISSREAASSDEGDSSQSHQPRDWCLPAL